MPLRENTPPGSTKCCYHMRKHHVTLPTLLSLCSLGTSLLCFLFPASALYPVAWSESELGNQTVPVIEMGCVTRTAETPDQLPQSHLAVVSWWQGIYPSRIFRYTSHRAVSYKEGNVFCVISNGGRSLLLLIGLNFIYLVTSCLEDLAWF